MSAHERWALILAGGVGTRFWPRSRRARPKQCLAVDGERTLLQATVDRIRPLIDPERVVVVTGPSMADLVRAQLPEVPEDQVLVEPSGRNTAPAIAWGSREIGARGGRCFAVLPADHRITDLPAFHTALRAAFTAADDGHLVTLGLRPTHPETGFGWIVPGDALRVAHGLPIHRVRRFTEKPDLDTARHLLGAGALWNGGMFCWRTDTVDAAVARHLPATARALDRLGAEPVEAVWPDTDAISVDHGVLEHADDLVVVPCAMGWSDVGSWTAMAEVLPAHALGHARVAAGLALDGGDHVVDAPDKLVVTVGVSGLVVVDTGDALLICRREDAQGVGRVVAELERRGLDRYT